MQKSHNTVNIDNNMNTNLNLNLSKVQNEDSG